MIVAEPKKNPIKRGSRDPRKRAASNRIDWGAALEFYLASAGARTYASVARQYDVSEGRVRQIAKRDDWEGLARAHDEAIRKEREKNRIPTLAERDQDTIRLIMAARLRFAAQLRDPNFRVTGQDLVALVKLERLIEGEATERVDITGEVEQVLVGMPEPLLRQVAGALLRGEDFDIESTADEAVEDSTEGRAR